jgi:hypothetical protein
MAIEGVLKQGCITECNKMARALRKVYDQTR